MANTLPIMEHFYTIQGEGSYTGQSAYFIRLGGCDVGCVWCDVKDSWDAEDHPNTNIDFLVEEAEKYPGRLVIITGGEPLMYDLTDLTSAFKNAGFQVNVETSGVYPVTGEWDWICFSPKKFQKPQLDVYGKAHELKVVVFNLSDLKWAEAEAAKVNSSCRLFLQPEWSKKDELLPSIIEYVKNNPQWHISLQTHKYLDIP